MRPRIFCFRVIVKIAIFDTSNFLTAAKLLGAFQDTSGGSTTVTSSTHLGAVNHRDYLSDAHFETAVTAGSFRVNGVEIEVDVIKGHKTGFYIDQRENRKLGLPHAKGKRVLDCCCYTGAWSLMCAGAGAEHVLGLDYSDSAIRLAQKNAERNGLTDRTEFRKADAFDELQVLASNREKFGVILLDPPSLARSRKGRLGAERGYLHLNRLAMGLLSPGGILVTCSCSHHVSLEKLREILGKAASQARKQVRVLGMGGQPEDHPSLLGVPETDYLKCFVLRVE